ncbi:MAG TPA: flagellar motor protein MotB [Bacteroidota bacterium]
MYQHRTVSRTPRIASRWPARIIVNSLVLLCLSATALSQEIQRERPTWWYGGAVAGNLNFYSGTTQMLNPSLTSPAPFHKGFGAGLYLAGLLEYRPDPVWGGMLQVGYDDRRGSFSDVPCPCGELATLSATISYISIEPSLRIAPFSNGFYIYGGPRIGFNWAPNFGSGSQADEKEFTYTQEGVTAARGQLSDMNGTVFAGQIGVGYDIDFASSNDRSQVSLSPFISYQPYFGQDPRSVENWGVSTLRLGLAIKFGSGSQIPRAAAIQPAELDVWFSVRAPKAVPARRRVRETFPLRNYVFFEEGSAEIPDRYVRLTKDQASSFKEEQLQEVQPRSNVGHSLRQMAVYYNILNVIGDRMKRSSAAVTLHGASANGPEHGKARAEAIKTYLVETFGVAESRISTEGRTKPLVPSELRGATRELAFLRAGDSRVDIESNSPELVMQVGGAPHHYGLKPVQIVDVVEDPLDSHVLFTVTGQKEALASWSVELTDEQGKVQRFGPSTRDRENVSGNLILGNKAKGDYKVVMLGQSKTGKLIRKESSVSLVRREEAAAKEAIRFRILFGFDESESVVRYEAFLTEVVAPLIPNNGVVVIHGYTDIVGEEEYNDNLSFERVRDTQRILERATSSKRGITYETLWFGENLQYSLFDNNLPEGRFYNRSVVIDVVPD